MGSYDEFITIPFKQGDKIVEATIVRSYITSWCPNFNGGTYIGIVGGEEGFTTALSYEEVSKMMRGEDGTEQFHPGFESRIRLRGEEYE